MVTFVTKDGTHKLQKKLRLSKPTDMAIYWQAIENRALSDGTAA
jgi:hypothetical protein